MDEKELSFILQEGEGLKVEFKESFDAKSIAKEMVAFANAQGGQIFLGVDDRNSVKGINVTNRLKAEILDVASHCEPKIKISFQNVIYAGKTVLVVFVSEGENKPYLCSSGFYVRQGAGCQKLTREEIFGFAIAEGKVRFDSQLNEKFVFENDFDEGKLKQFLKRADIQSELPAIDILVNLGLAVKKERFFLNNGGILFFAREPGRFFRTTKVICVSYMGNEKIDIIDRKVFDADVFSNIENAIYYVKKHIDVAFEIKTLKRTEILQFPEDAIRECVVNAVMHRDYFDDTGDVLVEVFKNKLTISNPGGLVKGLREEDFGKVSRTRNQLVADLLLRAGYVEKMGTGILRIKEAMRKAGLPSPEFSFNGSFLVTLFDGKVTNRVTNKVTNHQLVILEEVGRNKNVTAEQLSTIVGISRRKIIENLSKLKQKKLLERVGSTRKGYWRRKDY